VARTPDDPALAARFLGWLQARGRRPTHVDAAIERLSEAGAWTMTHEEAVSIVEPELLALLRDWRDFVRELPADWVGADAPVAAVQWIGPEREHGLAAPPGPVPRLVSRGSSAPFRSPGIPWSGLAIAGLFLLAAALPFARALSAARRESADLADVAAALRSRDPAGDAEGAREQHALAEMLVRSRSEEREAVNGACEGGAACLARLEALDASLRLATRLRDAIAAATPGAAEPPRTIPAPPAVLRPKTSK
jgi:hypothetical protein